MKMKQSDSSSSRGGNDQTSQAGSAPSFALPCQLFITHRGPDAREKNLATTICHTLQLMGLRVFMDSADLPSPQREYALPTSAVQIAIFPGSYAESPECVTELSVMLNSGAQIRTVFCDVHPGALHHIERGVYAEQKGRHTSQKLAEWKETLRRVSGLLSYLYGSPQRTSDHESLLRRIVDEVLRKVQPAPGKVVIPPVGLDRTVQGFENFLVDSDRIVGIVGIGGSGKSTLVQELYNRKRWLFSRSSFVPHVQQAHSENSLQTLQGRLLKDLLRTSHIVANLTEGKGMLRSCLRSSPPVLIILDSLPVMGGLRSGSLAIVTSRDEDVPRRAGICSIYKIRGLDPQHARELFCWHAFLQPFPRNGFEHLVEDCLQGCGGVPLSLKVLGAYFYGTDNKDYWRTELQKLSVLQPHDVKSRLKISYDVLHIEEKWIFLDIACFFLGEGKSLALRIFEGSGWRSYIGLQILEQKCLVELDDRSPLKMHDLLRDLATDIANEVSPCRLWHPGQANDILESIKGWTQVRGIMAATSDNSYDYPKCTASYQTLFEGRNLLESFSAVKLLVIQGDCLKKWYDHLSNNLVWLRWYDYPDLGYLPSMHNLRVLELIDGDSPFLWRGVIKDPLQLRELNIYSSTTLRELPESIGRLKRLEKMGLCGLVNMRTLPKELCDLTSLVQLGLRNCESLTSLPDRFGNLMNLRRIEFNGCSKLQALPWSFGDLISSAIWTGNYFGFFHPSVHPSTQNNGSIA